jgi:hypothetical protein
MAPPKAADVSDFLLLEMPSERIVQLPLRPRAQTRRAIADEHFLPAFSFFRKS